MARKISKLTNGLVGESRTGRTSSIKRRHRRLSRMWRTKKIRAASSKGRGPKATKRALTHSVTQRASRCAHSRPRSSLSAGSTRTQQEVVGSLLTLATRSSSLTSSRARAQCTCRRRLAYRAFRKLMRLTFRWTTGASVSVPRARGARAVWHSTRLSSAGRCVFQPNGTSNGTDARWTIGIANCYILPRRAGGAPSDRTFKYTMYCRDHE